MLDDSLKAQLKAYLVHLKKPIQITAFLDDSEGASEMNSLLTDILEASAMVRVEKSEAKAERTPSFSIHLPGEEARVTFAGLPMGHEFTSLVLAILHVGGHPPKVSDEVLSQIESLEGEFHFETYFSQSCQNCPDVVQALNILSARNPKITHVAIDGALFQNEVEKREVMAVPSIFLNGEPFAQGRMELGEVLTKIDAGASERQAVELNHKEIFDLLVVGGGPAGAAAAVYAARKGIRTGMVVDKFGGQILDTLSIENFISMKETQGPELAAALEAHVSEYPVDVMKQQRASRLVAGDVSEVHLESGAVLKARSVVISTGARWRDMGVPGEEKYRTKGVTYCPHCDGPLFKGKRVAVIGGGNSGAEAAIDLAGVVAHVTLLEFASELKADDILQRKLRSLDNVDIITSAMTTEVLGNERHVTGLNYEDRQTKESHHVELAGIFVQIGLLPNTAWLDGKVELSPMGEIVVGPRGETSLPGVFAAGDVTTVPYKQIIIAAGDGAKAALGAFDHLIRASAPSD